MPNHCGNRWIITGDRATRNKLADFLETTDEKKPDGITKLDFNNMRPLDHHTVGTLRDRPGKPSGMLTRYPYFMTMITPYTLFCRLGVLHPKP
jgi:hypothetical protein